MLKKIMLCIIPVCLCLSFLTVKKSQMEMQKEELSSLFIKACRNNTEYLMEEKKPVVDFESAIKEFSKSMANYPSLILNEAEYVKEGSYIYPLYVTSIRQKATIKEGLISNSFYLTMEVKRNNEKS